MPNLVIQTDIYSLLLLALGGCAFGVIVGLGIGWLRRRRSRPDRLKTAGEVTRGQLHGFSDVLPQDAERWRVARRAIMEEASGINRLVERLDLVVRLGMAGHPMESGYSLLNARPDILPASSASNIHCDVMDFRDGHKFQYKDSEVKGDPLALEPDPSTYIVACRIWKQALDGQSMRAICRAMEVPSPKGRLAWHPSTIHGILRNPVYAGVYQALCQEMKTPEFRSKPGETYGKTSSKRLPREWPGSNK